MKKLNRGYISIYQSKNELSSKYLIPKGYSYITNNHRYHDGADRSGIIGTDEKGEITFQMTPSLQILGAFHPFSKMVKDLSDTFRPYASTGKFKRDLLQPFDGLWNIARGIGIIIVSVIILALMLPLSPPSLMKDPKMYGLHLLRLTTWVVEGVANIIRGSLQFVTTPLTYFLKMPLRGLLTFFQKKPSYVEDKPEIQRLASEALEHLKMVNTKNEEEGVDDYKAKMKPNMAAAHNARESVAALLYEINRKYTKSLKDGWAIRESTAETKFEECYDEFHKAASISMKKKAEEPKEAITEDTLKKAREYLSFFISHSRGKDRAQFKPAGTGEEKRSGKPSVCYYGNKR